MELTEKTLSSNTVYEGRIITVYNDEVELPNGPTSHREVVRHCGAVCVLQVTEDGYVYLVRQYRYPYAEALLEAPAGKLESGESPSDCALRELKEETGITADGLVPLGKMYVSPGYCDEVIHLFAAKDLSFGGQQPDEDEFLDVVRLPLSEVYSDVLNGKIDDAKTQLIILKTVAEADKI